MISADYIMLKDANNKRAKAQFALYEHGFEVDDNIFVLPEYKIVTLVEV